MRLLTIIFIFAGTGSTDRHTRGLGLLLRPFPGPPASRKLHSNPAEIPEPRVPLHLSKGPARDQHQTGFKKMVVEPTSMATDSILFCFTWIQKYRGITEFGQG